MYREKSTAVKQQNRKQDFCKERRRKQNRIFQVAPAVCFQIGRASRIAHYFHGAVALASQMDRL